MPSPAGVYNVYKCPIRETPTEPTNNVRPIFYLLFLSPLIPHWWLLAHSRMSHSHPTSFPAKSASTRSRTRHGRCSHSPTRQLGRWVALLSYPNLLKLWCSHSLEKKMTVSDVNRKVHNHYIITVSPVLQNMCICNFWDLLEIYVLSKAW